MALDVFQENGKKEIISYFTPFVLLFEKRLVSQIKSYIKKEEKAGNKITFSKMYDKPEYFYKKPDNNIHYGQSEMRHILYNVFSISSETRVVNIMCKIELKPFYHDIEIGVNHMLSPNYSGVEMFTKNLLKLYYDNTGAYGIYKFDGVDTKLNDALNTFKKLKLHEPIAKAFEYVEKIDIDKDIVVDWGTVYKDKA